MWASTRSPAAGGTKQESVCSTITKPTLLLSLQEVVKLPLEFVRQLSIKVQHQRPGRSDAALPLRFFCLCVD